MTEHLKQQGSGFEVIPHQQAYTSTDEARALGIDANEVLKPLAMRTGPATRSWSSPLRVGSTCTWPERRWPTRPPGHRGRAGRDFAGYERALPPLGALLGAKVYVDPEVLGHDTVAFAAGTQTSRSRCAPRSCSAANGPPRCRWSSTGAGQRRPDRVTGRPVLRRGTDLLRPSSERAPFG